MKKWLAAVGVAATLGSVGYVAPEQTRNVFTFWFRTSPTLYVDNSGSCSDTGGQPGTQAQPFCEVQYGVSRLSSGGTLLVKNGTYSGGFTITGPSGTANQRTVIAAFPGHNPVLDNGTILSGRIKISHSCSYITFRGFTITNHNQGIYLDDDGGTDVACTNIIVEYNTVHDVGQEGIAIRTGSPTGPANFIVRYNTVYNTGQRGTSFNGEGIYVGSSSGTDNTNTVTLLGNTIHDTQDECIELKGDSHDVIVDGNVLYNCITPGSAFGSTGGAIEIDEPRNSVTNPLHIIRNNIIGPIPFNSGITKRCIRAGTGATIYNNVCHSINSAYTCILSNTSNYTRVIYHNTIDCTTGNALTNSGTTIDSRNNIGPTTSGSNLAFNSAYFVDATGHNYHLVAASAPINAGDNVLSTVPTDIEGVSRDTSPDIGAYQFP